MQDLEKDERYRYLVKHGNVLFIEPEILTIYVELPQIPGIVIVYRRPCEREKNPEEIYLINKKLAHIPLLEGEEKIKFLDL